MTEFHNEQYDDPFKFFEIKATQIRKLLLGSLLLAKNAWKDALLGTPDGLRVLKIIEEAEEEFIDPSIADSFAKLDDVLGVINKRARAVIVVMEYIGQFATPRVKVREASEEA